MGKEKCSLESKNQNLFCFWAFTGTKLLPDFFYTVTTLNAYFSIYFYMYHSHKIAKTFHTLEINMKMMRENSKRILKNILILQYKSLDLLNCLYESSKSETISRCLSFDLRIKKSFLHYFRLSSEIWKF